MHKCKRNDYLCTEFFGKMNENNLFGPLLDELRKQIAMLKKRCLDAEARVAELEQQHNGQQERIERLEAEKLALTENYQNLKAGAANVATGEEIEELRSRYLAMIREIDECIERLNGRPRPQSK